MSVEINTINSDRRHDVTIELDNLTDQEYAELVAAIGSTCAPVFYETYKKLDAVRGQLNIEQVWL